MPSVLVVNDFCRGCLRAGGDNPIPTPFTANGLIYVANGHGSAPVFAVRPTASGDISLSEGATANERCLE